MIPLFQRLLRGENPPAHGIDHLNGHRVSRLPVELIVAIDRPRPVKHFIGKALQPPALTGRQPADQATPRKWGPLIAGGFQRAGTVLSDTPTPCLAVRERQIDTVPTAGNRIALFRGFPDVHTVRAFFALLKDNAVAVLRRKSEGRFSALFDPPPILPFSSRSGVTTARQP